MVFWDRYGKVLKKIGIIGFVYLGMKYLVPLVIPFLVAGLAAWWVRPLLVRLEKKLRIRPAVSAGILLLLILGAAGFGIYFLGGRLCAEAERLLAGRSPEKYLVDTLCEGCRAVENAAGLPMGRAEKLICRQAERLAGGGQEEILGAEAIKTLQASARFAGKAGTFAAAVLITGIAFVLWSGDFEKIREKTGHSILWSRGFPILQGIMKGVGSYLRAQCILILLISSVCAAGFYLAGCSHPVFLGAAAGFLDALPILGTGIVLIPWIISRAWRGQYRAALLVLAAYGLCVLIREVLEPRMLGRRMGLFPILVLMSVYVGVQVYGAGGILLGPLSLLVIRELWRNV